MRIGVLTAGRGAPGANAVLHSLATLALKEGHQVVAYGEGFKGLIEDERVELKGTEEWLFRGSSLLKGGREPRFRKLEFREKAYRNLKEAGVEALVLLGGNGTMSAGMLIAEETGMPVVGVPCSAEGDVGGTEFCVGHKSFTAEALRFLDRLKERARETGGLFLARLPAERGYAVLSAGLSCGADALLLPEERPLREEVLRVARERLEKRGYFLGVACEGYGGFREVAELLREKVGEGGGARRSPQGFRSPLRGQAYGRQAGRGGL